jgi:sec-independent protein translocase protein TatA
MCADTDFGARSHARLEEISMGSFSIWHLLLIGAVLLLVFGGRGKLSALMGDAAKGVKAFKDGIKDEDQAKSDTPTSPLPRTDAEKEDLKR